MADDPSKTKPAQRADSRAVLAQKRATAMAKAGPGLSPQQAGQFFRDTLAELKKTSWPDRNVLTKSVGIVLAFIAATAVWVGVIDLIVSHVTAPIFGAH